MDEQELHNRKMPTARLVAEIKILQKELKTARQVLKTRQEPEQTVWICTICKKFRAADVNKVVQHIQSAHKFSQTDAIMRSDEIYI